MTASTLAGMTCPDCGAEGRPSDNLHCVFDGSPHPWHTCGDLLSEAPWSDCPENPAHAPFVEN